MLSSQRPDRLAKQSKHAECMNMKLNICQPQNSWLYGNHKPVIKDSTLSIWLKTRQAIPFAVTIPAKEVNENLKDELAEELPGIFNLPHPGVSTAWQRDNLRHLQTGIKMLQPIIAMTPISGGLLRR